MSTIIRPLEVHEDERGSVREAYRESWFGQPVKQVVHSESKAGVLRAMHAHKIQTDIWHFTSGKAQVQTFDHRSKEWQNILVEGEHTLVIPPGVSHGFLALTDVTLTYYLTSEYDGTDEFGWDALDKGWPGGKRWRNKDIYKPGILYVSKLHQGPMPMNKSDLIRSKRDLEAPSLNEFALTWTEPTRADRRAV